MSDETLVKFGSPAAGRSMAMRKQREKLLSDLTNARASTAGAGRKAYRLPGLQWQAFSV